MTKTIDTIFSGGFLKPLEPLAGLDENARIRVTFDVPEKPSISSVVGIMPAEDADEMMRAIEDEFSHVDPEEWK